MRRIKAASFDPWVLIIVFGLVLVAYVSESARYRDCVEATHRRVYCVLDVAR